MGQHFKCETKQSHWSFWVRRRGKNTFFEVPRKLMIRPPPVSLSPLLSRCNPMGRPSTARTFWTTLAALHCWWWASCCSPPSWFWLWLHTADWPDTSSWACVSSPTAGPSIRTYPPHVSEGEARKAAVADKGPQRGTGRAVSGFRTPQLSWMWSLLMLCVSLMFCFVLFFSLRQWFALYWSHCKKKLSAASFTVII